MGRVHGHFCMQFIMHGARMAVACCKLLSASAHRSRTLLQEAGEVGPRHWDNCPITSILVVGPLSNRYPLGSDVGEEALGEAQVSGHLLLEMGMPEGANTAAMLDRVWGRSSCSSGVE